MTIKDMEQLTGISKTNIRFYEAQGLITPDRSGNGYRVYNQSHADTLKQVKLLRGLDVPIETIRDLFQGKISLSHALSAQVSSYQYRHNQISNREEIIRQILSASEDLSKLNPDRYLSMLDTPEHPPEKASSRFPWQRFCARILDSGIYGLLIYLICPSVLQQPFGEILLWLLSLVLMLLLEPVMLCSVKTTPGKWIFGISVSSWDGKRLRYRRAMDRTFLVMQWGLGFGFPFLGQYFQYRSLKGAMAGEEQLWEQESRITVRDRAPWRYGLFLLCLIGLIAYPAWQEYQRISTQAEPVFSGENPFGHCYRVEEVLLGDSQEELPLIALDLFPEETLLFYQTPYPSEEKEQVCTFGFQPVPGNPDTGVWLSQDKAYQLQVTDDGTVLLEFLQSGAVQRRWKLCRIDTLTVRGVDRRAGGLMGGFVCMPLWFANSEDSENLELLPSVNLNFIDSGTITFGFSEPVSDSLSVTEEIHIGDSVTVNTYTLSLDSSGLFSLETSCIDSDEEVFVVYRVPGSSGVYAFVVKHPQVFGSPRTS